MVDNVLVCQMAAALLAGSIASPHRAMTADEALDKAEEIVAREREREEMRAMKAQAETAAMDKDAEA